MITKVKKEIRVLGWDDAPFEKGEVGEIPVIGVITRGGDFLDGVLKTTVEIDGLDATENLIQASTKTKHKDQIRLIILDGITFGGFNVVDIEELWKETDLPVIAVTRKNTNFKTFKEAMKNLPKFEERWNAVEKAGKLKRLSRNHKKIYFQKQGLTEPKAREIIQKTSTHSLLPEPIRVAHLIASAIVKGESIGGA